MDESFTYAVYNPTKVNLPDGVADKTTNANGRMVYDGAFGEHTYIEYINTNTGLKENIVLEQNIGKNRFEFVFESDEYIPVLSEDKTTVLIVHEDSVDTVKYRFAPLYVYDSYQPQDYHTIEAEPSRELVRFEPTVAVQKTTEDSSSVVRHFTEDNHYEITQLAEGKYKITSVVSEAFLNDPNTVYPVVIDPEINDVTSDNTNSVAQDSFVEESNPSNASNGNLTYLRFGKKDGGLVYAYHRFSTLPTLPANSTITNATLQFNFRSGQTSGEKGICMIVENAQWNESEISWNNQPYGSWGYDSDHNNYQYYCFYVKPFVDMWYNGYCANYGVCFAYTEEKNDYNSVVSSEGDADRAPFLYIEYQSATTVTADTSHTGTLDLGGNVWYKFIPAASGEYTFYTVSSVDTYGELYQGSTRLTNNDDGFSDQSNNWNFKITRTLTAGITYYLKVRGFDYEDTGGYTLWVKGKNAIIIIPGIMGTELKLGQTVGEYETGTILWPPLTPGTSADLPTLEKLTILMCDNSGNSVYNIQVRNDVDNFGTDDSYKTLYNRLSNTFGANYEIRFFGYDWRMPNTVSASLLRSFILEGQYTKVFLVAHSMGGLVASHLLTYADIRGRISTTITLGTPYLGALEMLSLMSHGELGLLDNYNLSVLEELFTKSTLKDLSVNIPSLYELLPTEKFFTLGNKSYYSIYYLLGGDTPHNTFSVTTGGLPIAITDFNLPLFNAATTRHSALWDGNTHATNYGNTYYIIGEGMDTPSTYTYYNTTGNYSFSDYESGDGTVLCYSASINDLYPSKTYFASDVQHYSLIESTAVLAFIINLINGSTVTPTGIYSAMS